MSKPAEVVVTGMGMVSPLGSDVRSTWDNLLEGKSGITRLGADQHSLIRAGTKLAACAAPFDLAGFALSLKQRRLVNKSPLETRMLVHAGLCALQQAELRSPEELERYRVGAIIGAGTALDVREAYVDYEERPPQWVLSTYPNLHLTILSIAASLRGPGSTVVAACTSGSQAVGQALWMIRSGQASVMLAGATENKLLPPFCHGFNRLNMSSKDEDPETAMRPFDRRRDGFVMGQGACVLVLESRQHAESRGAAPLARVVGFGSSLDADSITDASRSGIAASMRAALADARVSADEISHINAHGTSTVCNDREESLAIKEVFGRRAFDVPVSSTKSMIGHTFAACGAIEAAVSVMSLRDRKAHVTRGFEESDSDCDLDHVTGRPRDLGEGYCMSHSSGIGGYNSTLVLGRA